MHLTADARRDLYLLLKEAITNAAAHANAERVTLTTTIAASGTTIEVQDDGRGFDPALLNNSPGHGNGLRNMRARAESLGAPLSIEPSPAGTRVRLMLRSGRR